MKTLPLTITDAAYDKILEVREQQKIPGDYNLRLGVKSAGCGIASYVIGFDHKTQGDESFRCREMEVIIEKVQVMHLAGKKVDFDDVDGEQGFVFRDGN